MNPPGPTTEPPPVLVRPLDDRVPVPAEVPVYEDPIPANDPLHTASVGLDKWPWLRAVIACVFVAVWLGMLIGDWFLKAGTVPGWFQAMGIIVMGYLLGIDLITNFFRSRGRA